MHNKFRIDQALWRSIGDNQVQTVARFSVVGETFAQAVAASQILIAPHLERGLLTQIERIGVYCEETKCYRDVASHFTAGIAEADPSTN